MGSLSLLQGIFPTQESNPGPPRCRRILYFAPLYDIDEEAATGTSNGALAYCLYTHGVIETDKVYTVVQGEKMGRPSKISFQITLENGKPKVRVGGMAAVLAEGEIRI